MLDNTIAYLTPSVHQGKMKLLEERAELFNAQQIHVIVDFFENFDVFFPPSQWSFSQIDKQNMRIAIEFWKRQLRSKE